MRVGKDRTEQVWLSYTRWVPMAHKYSLIPSSLQSHAAGKDGSRGYSAHPHTIGGQEALAFKVILEAVINPCAQARIDSENSRLTTTRVAPTSAVALAAAEASGQRVPQHTTLDDLLRRPHVHYECAAPSLCALGF